MTVTLKTKSLTVPAQVQRLAGIKPGARLDFRVSGGVITILPHLETADDEYTPEQRRIIDRGIAQSQKEYKQGRYFGPFDKHQDFIASLHKEAARNSATKSITLEAMRLIFTPHFARSYNKAPKNIQQAFDKQSVLLRNTMKEKTSSKPASPVTGGFISPSKAMLIAWRRLKAILNNLPSMPNETRLLVRRQCGEVFLRAELGQLIEKIIKQHPQPKRYHRVLVFSLAEFSF